MLKYLDDVPWDELSHCYGPASDLPGAIRVLTSDVPTERASARRLLESTIIHQGTIYEASPEVVPFLLELVANRAVPERAPLLGLLFELSQGSSYHEVHAELEAPEHVASLEYQAELTRERGWVDATGAALAKGLGTYLALIQDPDPAVRVALGPLLSTRGDDAHAIEATIVALIGQERDHAAFLTLLMAPVFFDFTSDGWLAACRGFLKDPERFRQVAAAASLGFRFKEEAPDEALLVILNAIINPGELATAWEASPWSRNGFVGDLANVASFFGDARRDRVLPVLLQALAKTDRGDGPRLAEAVLWMAFGDTYEETPPAAELDPLQLRALQTIVESPTAWTDPPFMAEVLEWSELPTTREALAAYLGAAADGPLEYEITLQLEGQPETLPIHAWAERFFFELGLDAEGLREVLGALLSPLALLEVFGELITGAYGLDAPRMVGGERRAGHPQVAFLAALDEMLAADPEEVADWATDWLDERLERLREGEEATPRNIYGLVALVRAQPDQGIHPAYDMLIVPSRWALALEVLAALPEDRRQAVIMRHLSHAEAEVEGATGWQVGLGQWVMQVAPVLSVAPTDRIARALVRLALRSGVWHDAIAAVAEHGGQAAPVAAVLAELEAVDFGGVQAPADMAPIIERFR